MTAQNNDLAYALISPMENKAVMNAFLPQCPHPCILILVFNKLLTGTKGILLCQFMFLT